MSHSDYHFNTLAIHAGQPAEPTTGAVIVPISLSTTFQQQSPGVHKGYEYSRSGNPTRDALENNLAALEGAKYALTFSSGLGASHVVLNLLAPGDEIIAFDDLYGGTRRLLTRCAVPSMNLNLKFIDFTSVDAFAAVVGPQTKMVWLETPTNPTLKLADIKAISDLAHKHNAIVVTDNTFMSPYFQNPIALGADIVLHSATKYLGGHSDVVMGATMTNSEALYERMKFFQNALGIVPSPFDCFLAIRSTKTLHLRMQRHEENAKKVAVFLEAHAKVAKVVYPGLASHPQHELAKRQMKGFGGMITFYLRGGLTESKKFLESLKLIALAESLGGVESLIEHPGIMTHASVPIEARQELGIDDSMIRFSVGVEDIDDLIADLSAALDAI